MSRTSIAVGTFAAVLGIFALAAGHRIFKRQTGQAAPVSETSAVPSATAPEAHPSFLNGRITTVGGGVYEGRLRWGGGQEAFWGDYFNGSKRGNPWAAYVPPERLPKQRGTIEIFGVEIASRETPVNLDRLFMARFGDISSIEAQGRDVRVTLKSGTAFTLDRFSASDFDDGVRVWDVRQGMADIDSLQIRMIELLPASPSGAAPHRLHGTVTTRQGRFTGFIQWNRNEGLGADELEGRTAGGDVSLRFDAIRSIARRPGGCLVTLVDSREIALSGTREAGQNNLGIYVDDGRFGRVLISWDAFERVDFTRGGSGPAYGGFPPGGPLTGSVTTRAGRRLAGRMVYDLDESETTETLDAPAQGVDYTIPFGLIASIVLPGEARGSPRARVALHNGEELQLDFAGDLGGGNAGILIFSDSRQRPEYVAWDDVQRVEFDPPAAMYPPLVASDNGRARQAGQRDR